MKMSRPRIKPLATALLSGWLGVCLPAGSVVRYDAPPLDGLQHADEVPDELLGQQRGKYSERGRVINFGIAMESTWRTDKGELLRVGATLVVDARGHGGRPDVHFIPVLTIGESLGSSAAAALDGTHLAAGGEGVSSVNGVAQSIQIAGDGNHISNDAAVTIGSEPLPAVHDARDQLAGPASTTLVAASGASVHAAAEANGLAVAITVPNVGRVVQQVNGGGGGGIVQLAQAAGDRQWINNRLNIYVNLDNAAATARPAAMQNTLNMLRGLRPMGAY